MAEAPEESFFLILVSDVGVALARNESDDSQATRRDLIRTAFAAIEGLVWIFREQVVASAEETYGLDDGEQEVLQERQLSVSEQGKVSSQSRFLGLIPTIRLVARIASRINRADHFDFGSREWDGFRKAIAIRNRITHPKSANDLHLSKADVDQVTRALFWFLKFHSDTMAAMVDVHRAFLGDMNDLLERLKTGDPEASALYQHFRENED